MESVPIKKYIIHFSVVYIVVMVVLHGILALLDLEGNSGALLAILMGAAAYTASKFIKDNKRVPNKIEKSKLVWLSFGVSWVISIVFVVFFVALMFEKEDWLALKTLISEMSGLILWGAVIFTSFIQWASLSYGYGSLAKKQYTALLKKGKI